MLGVQEYDSEGKLICPLCRQSFDRLIAHIRQSHDINGKEYRNIYGFCKSFSFISKKSKELSRKKVLNNPEIIEKLTLNGMASRFKKNHKSCNHVMNAQRKIIIQNNKKNIKIKLFSYCLLCGVKLNNRKSKLCKKCYLLKMIERNKNHA